jgi:hypothetical protein
MKQFAKDAAERAIKTAFQTALALIGGAVFITDIDWRAVSGMAAMAALMSIFTSLASKLATGCDSASLLAKSGKE